MVVQSLAMAAAEQACKYVSYCERRTKRPDGTYTLFWVQDTRNRDALAVVVGTPFAPLSELKTTLMTMCSLQRVLMHKQH